MYEPARHVKSDFHHAAGEFGAAGKGVAGRGGKVPAVGGIFLPHQSVDGRKVGIGVAVARVIVADMSGQKVHKLFAGHLPAQMAGDVGHAADI